MDELRGKVAVITGAASGIGLGLAERAAREGMRVVLADIEERALKAAEEQVRGLGAATLAKVTDVRHHAALDALAEAAYDGVIPRAQPAWEYPQADWDWVFDVNVLGVVNGLRTFLPRMLAGGEEGHIVNTASMAGMITGGLGTAVYDASKHAVRSLSESLYKDLAATTSRIGASVLCPGAVATNIMGAERNRQADYGGPAAPGAPVQTIAIGGTSLEPADMAEAVFEAVRAKRFYVMAAQNVIYDWMKMGQDRIWEGKNPAVARSVIAEREAREAAGRGG
jgi:NAD(P)-dependent dehydrogenase (short-subunit alcohol dehydrogenase family)